MRAGPVAGAAVGRGNDQQLTKKHIYGGHLADDHEAPVYVVIEAGARSGWLRRDNRTPLSNRPRAIYRTRSASACIAAGDGFVM